MRFILQHVAILYLPMTNKKQDGIDRLDVTLGSDKGRLSRYLQLSGRESFGTVIVYIFQNQCNVI